jgi:hypothetical protein
MVKKSQRDWKQPEFDGLKPTIIDWAQLASFIDGEGSILINTQRWGIDSGKRRTIGLYLRVMVANTDIRLMEWLKLRFGGTFKDANTEKYYEGKNWKRAYHWGASSYRGAWLLHNCLPYFVMKREQAEIGIQLQESLAIYQPGSGALPLSVHEDRAKLKARLLVLKSKGIKGFPVPAGPVAKVS